METLAWSFAIGVVAGLRALTAPAAVAWAARLGWLDLDGTWASFMGSSAAVVIFTLLALFELYNDKLAKTPSRKAPASLAVRLASGAFAGAAVATGGASGVIAGALWGAAGAVLGTLGGYRARTGLVAMSHRPDYAVALLEDAVAIGGGLLIAHAVH